MPPRFVLRQHWWNGADRTHPRSRSSAHEGTVAVDLRGDRSRTEPVDFPGVVGELGSELAVHRRVARLSRARTSPRARNPVPGPVGSARGSAQFVSVAFQAAVRSLLCASVRNVPPLGRDVQRLLLPRALPSTPCGHRASTGILLSAGRRRSLESTVRSSWSHAVPMCPPPCIRGRRRRTYSRY